MPSQKNLIIIAAVVIAVVLGLFIWYYQSSRPTSPPFPTVRTEPTPTVPPTAEVPKSLGSEIYEKSNNPVAGKLPESNPVGNANPLEGAYNNPFQ